MEDGTGSGWIEVIIILLLILFNGLLSMSEIALVSSRKVRLQQRADSGDAGAKAALELASSPGRFLSTVQIGISLVGILSGAFGGARVAGLIQDYLDDIPLLAPYSEGLSVGIVVLAITYLTLVLGELAPKQIGINNAERVAAIMAPPMTFLSRLTSPVVTLLTRSTELVLRIAGVKPRDEPAITEEEIRLLIGQGTESGVFEPIEEEMVEQVFRLSDRRVESLTTPRPEIVWLDLEDDPQVTRQKIMESRHSHLPVAAGSLDQVLGFVRVADLMVQWLEGKDLDLRQVLQPGLFVPESMPAFNVLERFKETGAQIAFAVDEYGGIQGIVTLGDILEAIVGDIREPDQAEDPDVVQREDGSWLLDGMLPVEEFRELFNLKTLPGEEQHYFQTLGGFVMTHLGRIPNTGDHFEWEGLRLEVVDMDGNRVDKVLVWPQDGSNSTSPGKE